MAYTACTFHRTRTHDVYNTRSCLLEDPDPSFFLCDKNIHRYVVTLVWKTWSTQRSPSFPNTEPGRTDQTASTAALSQSFTCTERCSKSSRWVKPSIFSALIADIVTVPSSFSQIVTLQGSNNPISNSDDRASKAVGGWQAPRILYRRKSWSNFSFRVSSTEISVSIPNPCSCNSSLMLDSTSSNGMSTFLWYQ